MQLALQSQASIVEGLPILTFGWPFFEGVLSPGEQRSKDVLGKAILVRKEFAHLEKKILQ